MIRNAIANRLGLIAGAAMSVAGLSALDAGAQGTVTLSGASGSSCAYSAISINPAGNLTVTCQTGNPDSPPVCSITGPTTASANTPFTLSASCNPAASSWTWTGQGLSGSFSNQNLSLAAGTYTYTVAGTNAAGTGPVSASYAVTVSDVTRTGKPVCSFSSNPAVPKAGEAATITLNCTQSPSDYAWYQYEGSALGLPQQTKTPTQNVTFPSSGNYSFWLQAGNQEFGGGDVFSGTVKVDPVGGGNGCSASTAVPPSNADLSNLRFDLRPGQTGTMKFALPLPGWTQQGALMSVTMATKLETPPTTVAEVAIAPCPGQFDEPAVPVGCKLTVIGQSGLSMLVGDILSSSCPKPLGEYYVNVRHTTCNPAVSSGINYCSHYVNFKGR